MPVVHEVEVVHTDVKKKFLRGAGVRNMENLFKAHQESIGVKVAPE